MKDLEEVKKTGVILATTVLPITVVMARLLPITVHQLAFKINMKAVILKVGTKNGTGGEVETTRTTTTTTTGSRPVIIKGKIFEGDNYEVYKQTSASFTFKQILLIFYYFF